MDNPETQAYCAHDIKTNTN